MRKMSEEERERCLNFCKAVRNDHERSLLVINKLERGSDITDDDEEVLSGLVERFDF